MFATKLGFGPEPGGQTSVAMEDGRARVAVVTGASAGIGAAVARRLGRDGFRVMMGARRLDRLNEIAAEINGVALQLDLTDAASIEDFVAQIKQSSPQVDVLVNNAGVAFGLPRIEDCRDVDLQTMWNTNVLGLLRVTRACLPLIRSSHHGHIVNVGSTASFQTYVGGGGYTATKHAVRAISRTLRLEVLGEPIRITEIDPGIVRTEFSWVRFAGDNERASAVFRGIEPLTPHDVADCIAFAISRPFHVNIDEIVVQPLQQATAWLVAREPEP